MSQVLRDFLCLEGRADLPRYLDAFRRQQASQLPYRRPDFFRVGRRFPRRLHFAEPLDGVTIDVSRAHIWDLTGVNAIDKAVLKFCKSGVDVEVVGLNGASATIMDKLAMHDRPDAMEKVLGHSTHSGPASQAPTRVKTLV